MRTALPVGCSLAWPRQRFRSGRFTLLLIAQPNYVTRVNQQYLNARE
jgi:hypothetical protein